MASRIYVNVKKESENLSALQELLKTGEPLTDKQKKQLKSLEKFAGHILAEVHFSNQYSNVELVRADK